jgi:hypothetical protein
MEVTKMTRLTTICISSIFIGLMFAGQSYAEIDRETLLGAWLLDEGEGGITADASGNGNDGTLMGSPNWIAGQSGDALEFTGSGTYVDCGNAEALNVGVFSVSFWYNLPSSTQGWNHMVSRGSHGASGVPGSVNWGVMMVSGAQRILFETFDDTRWSGIRVDTTAGEWHHAVATYDGNMRLLYHDGVLADSGSEGMLLDQSRAFLIGARSDAGSAGGFFTGSIDEVGYFNAVLALEDVETLMNDGLAIIAGVGRPLARSPQPPDGAMYTDTWATLTWSPGDFAVSHDVYFGDNFDDVNDGTGDAFRGNVTDELFIVGFVTFPYPDGLVPGTTYYWRIDEVNDANVDSPWKGDVWSFWIPSRKAYDPDPPDGARYIDPDVTLSWTAGLGAKLHYVHFGDNFDDVNSATGGQLLATTTYTPGPLASDKVYYWRVDESDGLTTYEGDVWSFTTLPDIPITDPNLVGWWKFEAGAGTTILDFSGHDNHGTIVDNVQWVPGQFNLGLEFLGDDQGHVELPPRMVTTASGSVAMWVNTDQTGNEGMFWYGTEGGGDGFGDDLEVHIHNQDSGGLGFHLEGATDVGLGGPMLAGAGWTHVAATWDLTDGCRLYANGMEVDFQAHNSTVADLAVIRLGRPVSTGNGNRYHDGLMDDVRLFDHAISAAQVSEIMSKGEDPLRAGALNPANNAAASINEALPLSWSPGENAVQHDVYFGTDGAAVDAADASDTTGIYRGRQGLTSYTPPEGVELGGGPYYWRIDEVNNDGTITRGGLWSFTVADYGVVEDFESYNDIPESEPGSNLVYLTWKDGFDNPTTNGSTMGYPTGASMETGTVHGGLQSAPVMYNNVAVNISEVQRNFAVPQNWTNHGLITLSIWFYGAVTNMGGQMYVKVNGVEVAYDGDAANLRRPVWQVWNIDLASFGANAQSVRSLLIGIRGPGATGTLLFDDIRLYPYPGEVITPVQPDPAGFVAHFQFEGTANDSVGGHHGTPNGGPAYGLGRFGQAINLDGIDDYVSVGSVGISGADPRTIAGWAKAASLTFPAWVDVFGFTGPSGDNGHFDIELVGDTGSTTLGYYGLHVYGWEQDILPVDFEWHHLAASYDGTTIKWYGDGLLVGSADRTINPPDNVHIGKRDDNDNYFPGLVDDVQIFGRILSDAEVAGLAGITSPIDKPF